MKKLLAICTLCIIFLSSCEVEINNSQVKESDKTLSSSSSEVEKNTQQVETSDKTPSNSFGDVINNSGIITYNVYEEGARGDKPDEFSIAMYQNPIDAKMENDMLTQNIWGTRESQIFFDGYVKVWQDELEFSINNLKVYLTSEEIENLENAQKAWENNLELSRKFDRELIQNRGISLGTQYVSSALIYMINQHRERVFHIKYMTMLAEEYIDTPVQKSEQLWNRFHEPN